MFESLQDSLKAAVKSLRGKGKMTEANMREGLQQVRQALLEADVSYDVAQAFVARVQEQALGENVLLRLDPSQQVLQFVYQELVGLLGAGDTSLHLKKDQTNILMMCGLQGSGKTTTCGKLAKLLVDRKPNPLRPMLVAADLQRPAAIEQLHVLGRQLGVPVYSEPGAHDPVRVCQNAVAEAKKQKLDVVILDTAGRLAIDEELMEQLRKIDQRVGPDQVYLVVDGMTGQDAVASAKAFNERLTLNGLIMTKLDGDARGGALLSVRHVTGVPVKFLGVGEQLDALEPLNPEGMASRVLGGGDLGALVSEVNKVVDEDQRKRLEEQMREGNFSLDDFKKQIEMLSKPGLMTRMLSLLPGFGDLKKMLGEFNAEGDSKRLIGIINSMTPQERAAPKIIDQSRRQRIAKGAGVQPQEVNALVKQFESFKPLVTGMAGKSASERMAAVQQLQRQAMDPGGLSRPKGDTGKRLTKDERDKLKRDRERKLRQMKRDQKKKK